MREIIPGFGSFRNAFQKELYAHAKTINDELPLSFWPINIERLWSLSAAKPCILFARSEPIHVQNLVDNMTQKGSSKLVPVVNVLVTDLKWRISSRRVCQIVPSEIIVMDWRR